MKHFSIISSNSVIVSSNLLSKCEKCLIECVSAGKLVEACPEYNDKRRFGKIVNNSGTTFLCCDQTKTTKLFRKKLEGLSYAYQDLKLPKEELINSVKTSAQKRVNRLVHNLTSINAHNIQEIYDLVPQSVLTSDVNKQLDKIKKEIVANPQNAALMFLRIAKHNIHMKSEFSIYKKLERAEPTLDKRKHSVHKVLMNVLHTFFVDFSDKDVYVEVGECQSNILCDYEVVQVAFYHIIENSSKYVQHKTKIEIEFNGSDKFVEVLIKMQSLHIQEDEIGKIFDEGYSGVEAKRSQKDGEGIGLWRVKQMLELNGSTIEIKAGKDVEEIMGFKFSNNEISIKLMKF